MVEHYELPYGWTWAKLEEICEPVEQVDPRKTPNKKIKYVDISSIDNKKNQIIEYKEFFGREIPSRARKPIRVGDVLFSTVRTYLRNVAIVPEEYDGAVASTGFCVLRVAQGIEPSLIFHYLRTDEFISRISKKQRGISYPAVTDRDVYAEAVPIPPYSEQIRIIAKLETLFEELYSIREDLDKLPSLIENYRQAILASAFAGRLTKHASNEESASISIEHDYTEHNFKQRPLKRNNINEINFVDTHVVDTSDLPQLPDGWMWVTTEMLAAEEPFSLTDGPFGSNIKTADYVKHGVRVIRLQNIGVAEFRDKDKVFISKEKFESLRKYEAKAGDLIIAALADPVGRACIVPEGLGTAIVKADCVRLRVNNYLADSKYVMLALNTPGHFKRAEELSHGVGRVRVNLNDIKVFVVPLAPIREQAYIVARVQSLFAQLETIAEAVKIAQQQLYRLEQVILNRAFLGGLMPQNSQDEPALELLERVRQEKLQQKESIQKKKKSGNVKEKPQKDQKKGINTPSELTELLKQLQYQEASSITPRELWRESGLTIDDFYTYLKCEVVGNKIDELRRGQVIHLEARA